MRKKPTEEDIFDLQLTEDEKTVSRELRIPTHLDEFVFFQLYKFEKDNGTAFDDSLYNYLRIYLKNKEHDITRESFNDSLERLRDMGLITCYKTPDQRNEIGFPGFVRGTRQLPDFHGKISHEKIENLMLKYMKDAKKTINKWIEAREIPSKVKKIEKEVKESQQQMLRSLVSIFGVFVAIFSFILIGMNTALRIDFTGDICLVMKQVIAIIGPIIVGLILLLVFARIIYR